MTENTATEELLLFAFCCMIITVPFSFLVHARISYLQTVGQLKASQWMGILSNLAFLVAAACLLAIPFGVRGVFLAFPVSQVMTLLASWLFHIKRTGRVFPSESDYLEVDDSFYPGPGDVISYPIETAEDCVLASEQIIRFCRGHKLDERKALLAGLCMEEISTNVIKHGFQPTQSLKTADIRAVIDNGNVIIRIRDGGTAFNLKRFADRLEKEDAESAPGLKILLSSVLSVSYYRTNGMNTTILTI